MLFQWEKYVELLTFFCRGHPQVHRIDMLHAADYANMPMAQMSKKVELAKKKRSRDS